MMEQHLFDLLTRHGAWVLFAAQALGIVGLPIPDELLLTLAGGLVRRGHLRGPAILAAAIAGSITGTTLSYTLGRLGGRLLHHLTTCNSSTFERAQSWFNRFGTWLLVFGCFVPGVRHVTALAAGSAALEFRTFCAYAYPGVALWATTFVAIGYYAGAGREWKHAALLLRAHFGLVAFVLCALAVAYIVLSRRSVKAASRARSR